MKGGGDQKSNTGKIPRKGTSAEAREGKGYNNKEGNRNEMGGGRYPIPYLYYDYASKNIGHM